MTSRRKSIRGKCTHLPFKVLSLKVLSFAFIAPFVFTGCLEKEEPSPAIHQKKYSIDELERRYRDMPKRPEGYEDIESGTSISSQKTAFYTEMRDTFREIDQYKHDLASADKVASAREKKQRHLKKVKTDRKRAQEKAKKSARTSGEVINDYYN